MLSLPPTVRVFVAVAPLDMRGSFDALAGAVRRLGSILDGEKDLNALLPENYKPDVALSAPTEVGAAA